MSEDAPTQLVPEEDPDFPEHLPGVDGRLDWSRLQLCLQLSAPISERQPARELQYDFPLEVDADGYFTFWCLDMWGDQAEVKVHYRQLVEGLPLDPPT
jgi:hypothetical protein